jgi:hypothetical protein
MSDIQFCPSFWQAGRLFRESFRAKARRRSTLLRIESLENQNYAWLNERELKQIVQELGSCSEIDLVIPASAKDFPILAYAVRAARKHSANRIKNIYVISPCSSEAEKLCNCLGITNVDENQLLPMTKKSINYVVNGVDRSGWLFQQLLKYAASDVVSTEKYAVLDADTILLKKHIFAMRPTDHLFYYSDEFHLPYRRQYTRLTGQDCILPVSCVSHGMTFDCSLLGKLKSCIEQWTSMEWFNAILDLSDRQELSPFSEYECYGNFVAMTSPKSTILCHYGNLSIGREVFHSVNRTPGGLSLLSLGFKSVSGHAS